MRIWIVSTGVIAAAAYLLGLLCRRDPLRDSLRSHQRRQWAEGWTDAPYWPLESERAVHVPISASSARGSAATAGS